MRRRRIKYIRYVDDIRVLAKTEKEARRAAIALELECRKWSLIPQSSKFVVRQAKSLEDALGTLPSIVESATPADDEPDLDPADAQSLMHEAVKGRPLRVVDKTRLRYVLYRAAPAPILLRKTLDLLPRHPEHIDAFRAYLSNYSYSSPIMHRVREMLRDGVLYQYVEGELWQIAASMGSPHDLRRLIKLFRKRSQTKDRSMSLEWGLLAFAAASSRADVYSQASTVRRLRASDPYIQSLIVPYLDEREFRRMGVAGELLASPRPEPGLALAGRLLENRLSHRSFGLRANQLAAEVKNALHGLGLLSGVHPEKFDQVGDILKTRFRVDYSRKWRKVFGVEYAHALSMLLSADAKFEAGPSEWLSWQDSFNDALFRALQVHMTRLVLPGACAVTNVLGELIEYGSLLDPNKAFSTNHPGIAGPLLLAHTRRNGLPTSHPYEKKTGRQTEYLRPKERDNLAKQLGPAYEGIIALIDGHI
jgi:hypothetical protein